MPTDLLNESNDDQGLEVGHRFIKMFVLTYELFSNETMLEF
jgi:hypothetical protein